LYALMEYRFNSLHALMEYRFNSLHALMEYRFNSLYALMEYRFNSLYALMEYRFNSLYALIEYNRFNQRLIMLYFLISLKAINNMEKHQGLARLEVRIMCICGMEKLHMYTLTSVS
jgi:hypothetical protein